MKLSEFKTLHENRPVVYLDMDGVLADMFGEVAKREGAPHWRKARKIKDRVDQVAKEPGFFEELPPMPNAGKLVKSVVRLAGEFSILSSPLMSRVEQSSEEKADWVNRYLRKFPVQSVLFDHRKEKFARQADGTPNILIDDWASNIKLWEANGGIGILYKDQDWESAVKKLKYALAGVLPVEEVSEETLDLNIPKKLFTAQQVLKYIKDTHHDYTLDKPVLVHKTWMLTNVDVDQLKTPEFYDQDDPYRRVIDLDWDHIDDIHTSDIVKKPIVADHEGWVLDGNHRATAARARGLKQVPAFIPYTDK